MPKEQAQLNGLKCPSLKHFFPPFSFSLFKTNKQTNKQLSGIPSLCLGPSDRLKRYTSPWTNTSAGKAYFSINSFKLKLRHPIQLRVCREPCLNPHNGTTAQPNEDLRLHNSHKLCYSEKVFEEIAV